MRGDGVLRRAWRDGDGLTLCDLRHRCGHGHTANGYLLRGIVNVFDQVGANVGRV